VRGPEPAYIGVIAHRKPGGSNDRAMHLPTLHLRADLHVRPVLPLRRAMRLHAASRVRPARRPRPGMTARTAPAPRLREGAGAL